MATLIFEEWTCPIQKNYSEDYRASLVEIDKNLKVQVFRISENQEGSLVGEFAVEAEKVDTTVRRRINDIVVEDIEKNRKRLPPIDASDSEAVEKRVAELTKSILRLKFEPSESDDEFEESEVPLTSPAFARTESPDVKRMTVPCIDQMIKGSKLVEIAHQKVNGWYSRLISDEEETLPKVDDQGNVFLEKPEHWFHVLGGLSIWAPKAIEIQGCDFFEGVFKGVQVFNNGTNFEVECREKEAYDFETYESLPPFLRLKIGKNFKISTLDVTQAWDYNNRKNIKKDDLSYRQIVNAVAVLISKTKRTDSWVATRQLLALRGKVTTKSGAVKEKKELQEDEVVLKQFFQFLDYINVLMFGVESSGLNAGIVMSLMALDLIKDGHLTYEEAFVKNDDGGLYPYATNSRKIPAGYKKKSTNENWTNGGTYAQREEILRHAQANHFPLSMKPFRDVPAVSPVANKEAMLVKYWLKCNGLVEKPLFYAEQVSRIETAIDELIKHYFFPDRVDPEHDFVVEKFRPVKEGETK